MTQARTIVALATPPGRSGVAVFRISGPEAKKLFAEMTRPSTLPDSRLAVLRSLHDPVSGEKIDQALALYFAAPNSFTGEDVVELQTHGGRAVTMGVLSALLKMDGYRLAEAGEYTRRAFENGKMDLTEAEAVADLVHAETEAQRKQALRQMQGELGRLYNGWADRLKRSLAYIEAAIDFADEDLPADMLEKQNIELMALRDEVTAHLKDNRRGERVREGFSIAIIGAPNAGKSSLLNALAQRDAAIVSPVAGTTRDIVEVALDIGGYPVTLADTAGLRDSVDQIENEGVRRALARADDADLKLLVFDASQPLDEATLAQKGENALCVANKIDVAAEVPAGMMAVSVRQGRGLDALLDKIAMEIEDRFATSAAGTPPLTRARHRVALEECLGHLARALGAPQVDMRAEDVRLAMRSLGRITGRVGVEDLLDVIFRDFCIGK